jgi:diguanylate cyclase (GGDEF)-like protein/PAS domain S-box-containing protein
MGRDEEAVRDPGREAARELEIAERRIRDLEAEAERDRFYLSLSGTLLEMMDEAIFYSDMDFGFREANPAFYKLLEASPKELAGAEIWSLFGEERRDRIASALEELESTGRWKGEIRRKARSGEMRTESLLLIAVPDRDGKGSILAYVGMIRDLSELHRARAILEYSTSHDALTDLPNRDYFNAALGELAAGVVQRKGILAVCVLDMDDFKRINNDLSREAGDELLRGIGRRLSGALRGGDLLARTGGDEFSLAFPLKTEAELRPLAERILGLFEAPFETAGRLHYVNATMGVALCPQHGSDAAQLSACADFALQDRKIGAKNGFAVYRSDLGAKLQRKASLVNELRAVLETLGEGEGSTPRFYVHYQPLVEMATGLVTSTEALARWLHPERGQISPGQFIPLAEEAGLIQGLGSFVLKSACDQARAWQASLRRSPKVCINVSVRQLQDPAFLAEVRGAVAGLPEGVVTLEITESQLLVDLDGAAALLTGLKDTGVHVSVDDFGTGYASLSYLRKLPLDTVKIDQSFVKDLVRNRQDRRIVEVVATLAHGIGAKTVAEGVESQAQFEVLREIGCDYAQGFLFSPALPPEELSVLMEGGFDSSGTFTGRPGPRAKPLPFRPASS